MGDHRMGYIITKFLNKIVEEISGSLEITTGRTEIFPEPNRSDIYPTVIVTTTRLTKRTSEIAFTAIDLKANRL
jgi:hypothetical protein